MTATAETTIEQFATQALVLTYLQGQGYKIEKSALSNHVRQGLLKKKDGTFLLQDVDEYGQMNLRDTDSGEKASDARTRSLHEQKLKKDIALKQEQFLKARREREILEGKYVLRELVEIEQASRAAVLDNGILNTIRASSAGWIRIVSGDHAKEGELIQAMTAEFMKLINEYAALDTFDVIFKGAAL